MKFALGLTVLALCALASHGFPAPDGEHTVEHPAPAEHPTPEAHVHQDPEPAKHEAPVEPPKHEEAPVEPAKHEEGAEHPKVEAPVEHHSNPEAPVEHHAGHMHVPVIDPELVKAVDDMSANPSVEPPKPEEQGQVDVPIAYVNVETPSETSAGVSAEPQVGAPSHEHHHTGHGEHHKHKPIQETLKEFEEAQRALVAWVHKAIKMHQHQHAIHSEKHEEH